MARFGKRETTGDAAEQIADAAEALTASATEPAGEADAVTEIQTVAPLPIPPLLTDDDAGDVGLAADAKTVEAAAVAAPDANAEADRADDNVADGATAAAPEADDAATGGNRDRVADAAGRAAEHAGVVRDRAAEHAGVVRERAAEHAAVAREKLAESAGEARERLAEGAAEAKVRGAKMRKRFAEAAADARDSASVAAAEARERVANADVNEFAHSTTRLIDTARPFFLAGFAAVFAILGFLEGDAGTAELFVGGSILFVIGAGFSGEINAFVAHRLHHGDDHRHEQADDRSGGHHRGPSDD